MGKYLTVFAFDESKLASNIDLDIKRSKSKRSDGEAEHTGLVFVCLFVSVLFHLMVRIE